MNIKEYEEKVEKELEEIMKTEPITSIDVSIKTRKRHIAEAKLEAIKKCEEINKELKKKLKRSVCLDIVDENNDLPCDKCSRCTSIEKAFNTEPRPRKKESIVLRNVRNSKYGEGSLGSFNSHPNQSGSKTDDKIENSNDAIDFLNNSSGSDVNSPHEIGKKGFKKKLEELPTSNSYDIFRNEHKIRPDLKKEEWDKLEWVQKEELNKILAEELK